MKENFKIDKELLFKNNIKDITSISLDSDYKIKDKEVVGNFIISGEYKIHEVSINREKFEFKIPFKHEIKDDIDCKTLKLEINNFVYDYKKDELMVNIDYEINGARKDVLLFDDEETLDDFLKNREVEVIDDRIDEIKTKIDEEEKDIDEINGNECIEKKDNKRKEEMEIEIVDNVREAIVDEKEKLKKEVESIDEIIDDNKDEVLNNEIIEARDTVNTEEVINNVNTIEDKFITYKVVKLGEIDTIEGIVVKYHTSLDELKEYNDLSNIKINDKIIIPYNE